MITNRDMETSFTLRGPVHTPLSESNTQQRNNRDNIRQSTVVSREGRDAGLYLPLGDDIRQSTVVSRGHVSPKGIIVFIIIALFIYWAFFSENKPPAKAPSGVYEESLKPSEKPNTVTEGVITLKMDNAPQNEESLKPSEKPNTVTEGVITPKMDNVPQNRKEATKNARWSEEESIAKAPESWEEALRRARWSDEN